MFLLPQHLEGKIDHNCHKFVDKIIIIEHGLGNHCDAYGIVLCSFFSDMLVCLDILTAAELNKSLVIKEKGFYHIGKIRKYGLTS